MTQNTKQTETKITSYDAVAEHFSEEAKSLLSDSAMDEILAEEKLRFDHASILQISPARLTGNNTLRYCKDLLRGNQPFPFLYSALCFLTEVSILMLLYGIVMGIYGELAAERNGFFAPFSYLYVLIIMISVTCCNALAKRHLRSILAIPFSQATPSEDEIRKHRDMVRHRNLLSFAAVLALAALAAVLVFFFKLNTQCSTRVYTCFFAYIACMVLLGIHNVIYSSHLISFFAIGGLLVARRPPEEIEAASEQYLNLSYTQILSTSHRTPEDCSKNPELMNKLRTSVYSRTITGRIYYILGIFILLVLDIVCTGQIRHTVTPALLAFFAISAALTLLLAVAVVASNHIIKLTRK